MLRYFAAKLSYVKHISIIDLYTRYSAICDIIYNFES